MENRNLKFSSGDALNKLVSPLRLSISSLHNAFINAIESYVLNSGDVEKKPLVLDLASPLPTRIRLYIYNLTHPPGGRSAKECKIQLILPGQETHIKGNFDISDGRFVLLCGYDFKMEVFVLWDSEVYKDFAYSRNVQIKFDAVCTALTGNIGQQERLLANGVKEIVLTCQSSKLYDAIRMRWKLSIERVIGGEI